jgi:hypothetical protein
MKIPKGKSGSANQRRTDNTMVKRKKTKGPVSDSILNIREKNIV